MRTQNGIELYRDAITAGLTYVACLNRGLGWVQVSYNLSSSVYSSQPRGYSAFRFADHKLDRFRRETGNAVLSTRNLPEKNKR